MHVLSQIFEAALVGLTRIFAGNDLFSLLALTALTGVALALFFKKGSNPEAIRVAKRKIRAALYEMRLFEDDPVLVLRAQGALFRHNATYIRHMARPLLLLAVPVTLLTIQFEAFYGKAPLKVGSAAVVTMQYRKPIDLESPAPRLIAPEGILVETPAVRVTEEGQVSWRIRPVREVHGTLRVDVGTSIVEKEIQAGGGARQLDDRRVSSLLDSIWHPIEPRITHPDVEFVEVVYPPREFTVFGVTWNWMVWFVVVSMATILLLKRPLKLAF